MRSWWWVKEKKKQMALVLIIATMILQFQMKGCVGCVETERIGLLHLKSYLSSLRSPEEESILDSWSDDDPQSDCCNWEGVKCSDAIGGRIVNLSLTFFMFMDQNRGLNISLLHSFPQLKTFDFSGNRFDYLFDPIHGHKSLQRLENLENLDLSDNRFNNSVLPFLSAARSLRILNLGSNSLEGVFPLNGFNNFRELEELDLSFNRIHDFKAGEGLRKTKLRTLLLSNNRFSDLDSLGLVLPSSLQVLGVGHNNLSCTHEGYSKLCGLRNLRELELSGNDLTSMPNCLGNLSRLRTLELSDNQLDGNLSAFVFGLPPGLEYLSLLDNNFNGSFLFNSLVNQTRLTVLKISSKVGIIQAQAESPWVPLFQLKMLELHNFTLGSIIPGFLVYQHDLFYVNLSHNKLITGAFARWLVQNNTRLQALSLNNNLLTELQLPRLVHGLQYLDVSSNRIYDSIQEDIGIVFPKMRFMNFSSNQFHGTIPFSMGEMKSLETLDMSSNGLLGKLPQTFWSGCYSLVLLKLSNNKLQGKIFPEHANLTSLAQLFLDGNNFTGCIGEGLLNSKELVVLDLSDNKFSGMFPLWMGGMISLEYLFLRGNQLKGTFPHQLLQSVQLHVMDISHNSFSGSIPKNVIFSSLEQLRLQNNDFWGSIPDTLFKGEMFQLLDLRNNNFSGEIPNTIGESSSLRVLLLGNNSLQSHIPEKICQLSEIGLLDLSHNKFNGAIPSCLDNMSFGTKINDDTKSWVINLSFGGGIAYFQNWSYTSALPLTNDLVRDLEVMATDVDFLTKNRYEAYQGDILRYMYGLDLSSNRLSGEIPVEIGNLENIRCLNFSGNRLTGTIPYSFSKLKDLESLDLSRNRLHGNIPPVLANLDSLGYFNVSCNNFSGEIPFKGHLLTFDERSYIGNAHLCGRPTNISCNPTRAPEESAPTHANEEEDEVIDMEWFYWTCGAVYISTCLALFAFLCIDTRWSQKWFYRVDLFIHHLQRFKRSAFRN